MTTAGQNRVRLAELMGGISMATDLATGQPMGHALRTCYLAVGLAREMGLAARDLVDTYYVSLLRFLGCTAQASEDAELNAGDDIALYAGLAPLFMGRSSEGVGWVLRHLAEGGAPLTRARARLSVLTDPRGTERSVRAHCEVGQMLARLIGLGESVLESLSSIFERWDGKGLPNGMAGEEIPASCRTAIVARDFDLLSRLWGLDVAKDILSERKGKAYDPRLVDAALEHGAPLIAAIEDRSLWEAVLDAEPGPSISIEDGRIDDVLRAFAHFADLKSPFLHGHSVGVAQLAERAAAVGGAAEVDPNLLRRAALVHDLGRVAVPSGIWNKERSLSDEEWERVRLYPYYTERILIRCEPLKDLAQVASSQHERNDGSGYHRGIKAPSLSPAARLLAAADAFRAMTEPRPHRRALAPARVAEELERACSEGQMDAACVRRVLEVAGRSRRPRVPPWPAGLTDREVDVLRLLSTGLSNKQIATKLTLSPKTVGRHIENIYPKIGVSTRAGATLFAVEHGLVGA